MGDLTTGVAATIIGGAAEEGGLPRWVSKRAANLRICVVSCRFSLSSSEILLFFSTSVCVSAGGGEVGR